MAASWMEQFAAFPSWSAEDQFRFMQTLQGIPGASKALQQYLTVVDHKGAQETEEENRKKAEAAANPYMQVATAGAGALATGLGIAGGTALVNGGAGAGTAAALTAPAAPTIAAVNTGMGAAPVSSIAGNAGATVVPSAAPAASGAVPATTGATPGIIGSLGAGPMGMAGGAAGLAAGGLTGYEQYQGIANAFHGKDMKPIEQAALALPTFGLSFASNLFNGGKSKDQKARDAVRGNWEDSGIIDDADTFDFGNGTTYDASRDGGFTLQNTDGSNRHGYDIDWSAPNAGNLAGAGNAFSIATGIYDPKQMSDAAGIFGNATSSGGNWEDNARAAFDKAGGRDANYGRIVDAFSKGKIDAAHRDASLAEIDRLYGVKNPNAPKGLTALGKH